MPAAPSVVVVGAGAFGGWTALYLLRHGARVTLIDAWGPGNSRASSGGETRIIRGGYGANQPYTRMTARALELWSNHERLWQRRFLYRIGVLWMASEDDSFERGSLAELASAKISFEELSLRKLTQRWPQINFDGIKWAVLETGSGYLTARSACQAVVEGFIAEGGRYIQAAVVNQELDNQDWTGLQLCDGSELNGDKFVFACGPWMGKLFPRVIGDRVSVTKQDMFFFGTPYAENRYDETQLPVWADHRGHFFYGIPGNQGRGFKITDDTRGPRFDPTCGERVISWELLDEVRQYMAFRFPGMANSPLVETRVCQYENSPDTHFIIDRHPCREDVWLLGGGSGHGFKHGPVVGEMVAGWIVHEKEADPLFQLARFKPTEAG
ncbi:MAG: FAD-dependent oxidoreductase, partial [Acidobacteria bacterium]|nr:FAD-dependent oxidoreductase [Acidobacteriota bacterium]